MGEGARLCACSPPALPLIHAPKASSRLLQVLGLCALRQGWVRPHPMPGRPMHVRPRTDPSNPPPTPPHTHTHAHGCTRSHRGRHARTFWCVSSMYSLRSSASCPALTRLSSPSTSSSAWRLERMWRSQAASAAAGARCGGGGGASCELRLSNHPSTPSSAWQVGGG